MERLEDEIKKMENDDMQVKFEHHTETSTEFYPSSSTAVCSTSIRTEAVVVECPQSEEIVDSNSDISCPSTSECAFLEPTPEEVPPPPQEQHMALLPPDHPMMQKFQQLLKEHLLRTKVQLVNDIADIKYELKHNELQREEEGAKLYDMQQELRLQNEQLEDLSEQINQHVEQRQKVEASVSQLKEEYNEKQQLSKTQKAFYNQRMMELENINSLEKNMINWADGVEDEVKNAKRIVSRDAQLQKQLSEDKRKSDLLFFNLDMEVKKREKEIENLHEELKDQRGVINLLQTSISYADADLETLQSERKRMTQAWGEVIVAISHRDKLLFQVNTALK